MGPFLVLVAGLSPALAAEEETTTIAVVRLGEQPAGGRWVTTAEGRRCVLKGKLALAVADDSEVFTVGGGLSGRTLTPTWIRAQAAERIRFGARHRKSIEAGATVKVVAVRTDRESTQREFEIVRGRDRLWLADYRIDFAPPTAPIVSTRVAGRVELKAGQPHLLTQVHGRLAVLGSTKSLLLAHVGRFVQGHGLVLRDSKKLLLTELDGETIEQTDLFPSASGTRGALPRAANERVRIVSRASNSALLQLRFNWPEGGEGTAYIPASKVSIGKPWQEITGELVPVTNTRFAIATPTGRQLLDPDSFDGALVKIVRSHVGRKITVGGLVDSLGVLHARSLSAQSRTKPLRITGVTLDANKDLAYVVTTPEGEARVLPRSSVGLTEGTAAGASSTLDRLP